MINTKYLGLTANQLAETASKLEDENARLRELVRDMSEWAYVSEYCDLQDEFADRMRELGVDA